MDCSIIMGKIMKKYKIMSKGVKLKTINHDDSDIDGKNNLKKLFLDSVREASEGKSLYFGMPNDEGIVQKIIRGDGEEYILELDQ